MGATKLITKTKLLYGLIVVGGISVVMFSMRGSPRPPKPLTFEERVWRTDPLAVTCLQKDALTSALLVARRAPPLPPTVQGGCPPTRFLDPPRTRDDVGALLRKLNLTIGIEVGTQNGLFTRSLLETWQTAEVYIQVDVWQKQQSTYRDTANVEDDLQQRRQRWSCSNGLDMQAAGFVKSLVQCQGTSTECAGYLPDDSLDFVYVDARHDRKGVLDDMKVYWPKLRDGGVMSGHDYLFSGEDAWKGGLVTFQPVDMEQASNDYRINFDGTVDHTGQVVRGAVNDFFSGVAEESPEELKRCPRQPVVTYREAGTVPVYSGSPPTWVVRK